MNKKENKFIEITKKIIIQYNVGLILLSIVTAVAYAISNT